MGRVFIYNDLTWFHLPMRYLYQQALRSGDSILWTPAIFSGLYVTAKDRLASSTRCTCCCYRVLPLQTAFNLELAGQLRGGVRRHVWFLRRLRFARPAALFGAMLFAFSGFNLLHHHHLNMVAVVAHLPWLLAAADMLIVEDPPATRGGGVRRRWR